jgi:hypothetical protein
MNVQTMCDLPIAGPPRFKRFRRGRHDRGR